ncbi:hypothetical protein FH972_004069 [Carpinus fangiana]|uniref:Uncharacterized protein n=1 Tax=Carpinus fangiana TaxID=176857 RepID=A0A5N6QNI9_9ROSI|nr:hypothetical protein FH972_004069 [Carpinus fangiana]
MRREPHEDSTTNSSAAFVMPNVQRFPSISMSFERDDMPILMDDGSHVKAENTLLERKNIIFLPNELDDNTFSLRFYTNYMVVQARRLRRVTVLEEAITKGVTRRDPLNRTKAYETLP